MTISSELRTAGPFVGAGGVGPYAFTFKVFAETDLYVVKYNAATLVQTLLVYAADYTVVLNDDQDINPGGTITLTVALAVGFNLTITSNIPYTQLTDLHNQGGFYPKVLGDMVDRLTIQLQQVKLLLAGMTGVPLPSISDIAYAATWDGVIDAAPSKNAVYDKIETLAPKDDPTFTGDVTLSDLAASLPLFTDAAKIVKTLSIANTLAALGIGQVYFFAYLTATQSDVTGDGTAYNIIGAIWTEVADTAAAFSNGTFTAPSTGRYLFSGTVSLSQSNTDDFKIFLVTSNRDHWLSTINNAKETTKWGFINIPFSVIADMDAGDTAYIQVDNCFDPANKITDVTGPDTLFYGYKLP
jgi:hypothetical protein